MHSNSLFVFIRSSSPHSLNFTRPAAVPSSRRDEESSGILLLYQTEYSLPTLSATVPHLPHYLTVMCSPLTNESDLQYSYRTPYRALQAVMNLLCRTFLPYSKNLSYRTPTVHRNLPYTTVLLQAVMNLHEIVPPHAKEEDEPKMKRIALR